MNKLTRILVLLLAAGFAALAAAATPRPLPDDSVYQLALPLLDQHGRTADWRTLRGKPRLVAMFYTSCQYICPLIVESGKADFKPLYPAEMPLFEKINTIATEIYRADAATADASVKNQLKAWEEAGFGNLPVCMAKTQYSFTTDPTKLGAPTGFTIPVREVRLAAGAGFIVAICGEIMTMPGLPKVPSAEHIRLENGKIEGLF